MSNKAGPETPSHVTEFRDFPGIILLDDPVDLPPGSGQDQMNIKSDTRGQLAVRGGVLPVLFDSTA